MKMMNNKYFRTAKTSFLLILLALFTCAQSCRDNELLPDENGDDSTQEVSTGTDTESYPDWSETTHGNSVAPDYSIVFPQNTVLRFDIEISADDWATMQSDLATNLASSSTGGRPGMGGGGGGVDLTDYTPIWVPCSLKFNGIEWYHVGIRFKGNSSLQSAYQSGNNKLSLKLDFDEFEDDYPGIKNQRFYGFKQLNLNNNYNDASLMREKVGADLFREFGLAASKTSFCVVYLDHGNGPQYYGVYTLVEEVDDTVIETQFTDGSGNLYKPDGTAASFAYGTFNVDQMYLKTNEDSADYSDVRALYDALHSSLRTTDAEAWKNNLESVLYVDGFLKWLAANTVIQNWDTYGRMTHNYYLYNNPENNLLTWIPWDNNEAFQEGKQGGALSLSLSEVNSNWPLISYLIQQEEYKNIYHSYLNQFISEVFTVDKMTTTYSNYYDLLKEYAYTEQSGYTYLNSSSSFDLAVETLKTHVQSRNSAVSSYLAN